MVVDLCCYAGLSGSSAGLGIELALFSSHSCQNAEPDWTCYDTTAGNGGHRFETQTFLKRQMLAIF